MKKIRKIWDSQKWDWHFPIIDIIEILTDSTVPKRYWSDLKIKLKNEWNELCEKIVQLKMKAIDGKNYLTEVWDAKTILRLIQSISSKKAEPFSSQFFSDMKEYKK